MQTIIEVDVSKPAEEQSQVLHNRWHPDIPMAVTVKAGDSFRVQCMDWTGGQIRNDDCADDILHADLTRCHYLSGPIGIEGAEPGDLLVVDILDVAPLMEANWGFTGIFAKENGGGFLSEHFPDARKACWDFHGIYTSSRHIPRVRFPGTIHPGIIGCAPSHALLKTWNEREKALLATDPNRVPPLANPPYAGTALLGSMPKEQVKTAALEAARTIPPREHGGNCDIKNLSRSARVYLPVYIKDAGLSVGDLHFSQGDGEITFCGAIEMAGYIDLHVEIIKNGMSLYGVRNPIFKPSPIDPHYDDFLIFEGISVDEKGTQHYLDAHVAFRQACLNAITYLKKFGYSGEQAYAILGSAPVEGHISSIVDIPNACATLWIPTAIFDFDIAIHANGPQACVPAGSDLATGSI